MKPNKFITYVLYTITAILVLYSITRMLGFMVGSSRIQNNISPYTYTILLLVPVFAYSFYVNSGIPKDDMQKVHMYMISCTTLGIIIGGMACTWISNGLWYILEKIPGYSEVMRLYPEFFAPAIKTICFSAPFVTIFKFFDYFLEILREEIGRAHV